MSAEFGSTVMFQPELSFALLVSLVDVVTLAVFVNDVGDDGAVVLIVMVGAVPTESGAVAVQVTVSETTLQFQPVPFALMPVWPAGSVSVTTTPAALSGPLLVTMIEYGIAPLT